MVTPREVRAARALLGWSRQDLADRAIVSLNSVLRYETGADTRTSTASSIRKALEKGGVEFLSLRNEGEGVRIKRK